MTISRSELTGQLNDLGVRAGGVLLVHCAFRAVRPVEDGPHGLIAALQDALGPNGTLVMPPTSDDDDSAFDPQTTRAASALGAVADIFWRMPGVERSCHFAAFAARGPSEDLIVGAPLVLPPSAPGSSIDILRDLDAQVLLLGCGHEADTTIHLGEVLGGAPYRVPKHFTIIENGLPKRVQYGENDHCCDGFSLMDEWLRADGRQREGSVGYAHARLARAQDIVDVTIRELARNALVFLHAPEAGCDQCDEARASSA